nr:HPr family phosphocarrier protein [Oscillospiraceae bacterium]
MRQFTYVIKNAYILHFGPAGRMAELTREYSDTTATLEMGNRVADLSRPMKVATMGVRMGDKVTVTADGPSEVELLDVLYQFFQDFM